MIVAIYRLLIEHRGVQWMDGLWPQIKCAKAYSRDTVGVVCSETNKQPRPSKAKSLAWGALQEEIEHMFD